MRILEPDPRFAELLEAHSADRGILEYHLLEIEREDDAAGELLHRRAAHFGMVAIDRRIEDEYRQSLVRSPEFEPGWYERRFRLQWDVTKAIGRSISFAEFWGTDCLERRGCYGERYWIEKAADGYKSAFFLLRHGGGDIRCANPYERFDEINETVLGPVPGRCEFYAWSTDWSNYFDSAIEGGDFYWTVRHPDSRIVVVIAGSLAD